MWHSVILASSDPVAAGFILRGIKMIYIVWVDSHDEDIRLESQSLIQLVEHADRRNVRTAQVLHFDRMVKNAR